MVFGDLGRDAGAVLGKSGTKFWRCDCDCRCQEDRLAASPSQKFVLIRVRVDAN